MELFLNPSIKGPWFEPIGYLDTVAKSEMASILRRHGFRWTGYHKTGKYSDLRAAIEDLKSAGFRVTVTQEIVNHFAAMLDHKEKAEEALDNRISALEALQQSQDPEWRVWPHQREAAERLAEEQEWILADDPGLGKTLSFLLSVPDQARLMVLCPLPAKPTWCREIRRARPEFRVQVLEAGEFRWPDPGECVLVHWASLPYKAGDNEFLRRVAQTQARNQKLKPGKPLEPDPRPLEWWCRKMPERLTLILDEAHEVCNGESSRTKRWRFMRRQAVKLGGISWLGTATPILNREKEFWEVLKSAGLEHRCFPEGAETYYRALGGILIDKAIGRNKSVKVWSFPREAEKAGLQDLETVERLAQGVLRRTQAEVYPDMPRIVRDTYPIELAGSNLRALQEVWDRVQDMTDDQILIALDGQPEFSQYSAMRSRLAMAKAGATAEVLRHYHESTGEPVVFCSYHRAPLEEISRLLGGPNLCPLIMGGVEVEDRGRIEDGFQGGEFPFVGFTSGTGVSFTLSRSRRMVVIDQDFRQGMNFQAEGRLRAHLQERSCHITYMTLDHPLEYRVTEILMRKTALISKTVNPIADARARQRSHREGIRDTLGWLRAYLLVQAIQAKETPQDTGHLRASLQSMLKLPNLDAHRGELLSGIQRRTMQGIALTEEEIAFVQRCSVEILGERT